MGGRRCCHIVALTGGSDVALATICVAPSPVVIASAPKSGTGATDAPDYELLRSYTKMKGRRGQLLP